MAVVLSLVMLFSAGDASAHVKEEPVKVRQPAPAPADSAKSLTRAILYSFGGTFALPPAGIALARAGNGLGGAAGYTLIASGVVLGPSAGHFYLGNTRRAWMGVALRSAGISAIIVGLDRFELFGEQDGPGAELLNRGAGYLIIGGFIVIGLSMGSDLLDLANRVDVRTQRRVSPVHVQPILHPGRQAAGLALSMRF